MDTPNVDKATRARALLETGINRAFSSDGRIREIVVRIPVSGKKLGEPTLSVAEESR